MNSALLALFTRALREDVRSKSMYWARAGLVGLVLLNLGLTHVTMGWAGAPGLVFFNYVVWLNLFFISLAGLSYFSSAITEEKEDMTLGLLRMTNLDPLSILLGKSASRQIGALLLLLSQVPFTLLAVALGGVTLAQIIAAYACLAAYALFLGNVALFFSVMMRRSIFAAILTFFVLFIFLFGSWLVRYPLLASLNFFDFIASEKPGPWLDNFLTQWQHISPLTRLDAIGVTGFHDGPVCFQVVANILLGVAFFLGAWAIFDVFCNEEVDASPARGILSRKGKRFNIFSYGRPGRRALFWKDFHFIGGGIAGGAVKFVVYSVLLCLVAALVTNVFDNNPNKYVWKELGYTMIWGSFFVLFAEVAFIAARVFRQERIWKTWSSLSMLPMSTRRIAYQKILGALATTWPAVLFCALGAALVADDLMKGLAEIFTDTKGVAITVFAFVFILLAFFYHLIVHLSLRLKWGALPLAFAVTCVGTMMAGGVAGFIFKEATFVVLDFTLGILVIAMHYNIGERLEKLASED